MFSWFKQKKYVTVEIMRQQHCAGHVLNKKTHNICIMMYATFSAACYIGKLLWFYMKALVRKTWNYCTARVSYIDKNWLYKTTIP